MEQLQSNKLFFSSADHYDDLLDTYFYIDHKRIRYVLKILRDTYNEEGTDAIRQLLFSIVGADYVTESPLDFALTNLNQNVPETTAVENELDKMRNEIQKCCYSICFFDDPLNESLWLKYANNHADFVQVYNTEDPDSFCCGSLDKCKGCMFETVRPQFYPVYYTDSRYDATIYAIIECALKNLPQSIWNKFPWLTERMTQTIAWEIERITLIKSDAMNTMVNSGWFVPSTRTNGPQSV